jgi:hypothetical protein
MVNKPTNFKLIYGLDVLVIPHSKLSKRKRVTNFYKRRIT